MVVYHGTITRKTRSGDAMDKGFMRFYVRRRSGQDVHVPVRLESTYRRYQVGDTVSIKDATGM